MAEEDKKEDQFEFNLEGEALGYISLDQARVLAMRAARESPGDYGSLFLNVTMAFEVVESSETEDHYVLTLSFRPQGQFTGTPGQEQFFIEKEGEIAIRQVLSVPRAGRRFPILPAAIGVLVVVIIAAVAAVLALGGPGENGPPVQLPTPTLVPVGVPQREPTATPLTPTATPISTPAIVPTEAPTSTPTPVAVAAPLTTATPIIAPPVAAAAPVPVATPTPTIAPVIATVAPVPVATLTPTVTPVATPVPATIAPLASTIRIQLLELNGSGQSGQATLINMDRQTQVTLNISLGKIESELVHIHAGQCGQRLGGVNYGLTSFVGGYGVTSTIVEVPLANLMDGNHAILNLTSFPAKLWLPWSTTIP